MDHLAVLFQPEQAVNQMPKSLPPEIEEGNIEYKLKLISPSPSRFEHLVTQMKWRLQEGHGEAIYEIGVEDSGILAGLNDEDLQASLDTLQRMASKLGASCTVIREREVDTDPGHERKRVKEVLIRKVPDDQQFIDLRLAVLGNVDSGKSTLLGVLTQGELDNGHGRARLNLFRHLHEIQTGRTSSISHEILGFDSSGQVVNYSESRTADEICETSSKLITLIDLAGHHKYLRTTIFGLTGYSPDFAMLVISANTGIAGTTKEHLGFALHLQVPIFIVINKIDMVNERHLHNTLSQVEKLLKSPGVNKIPYRVECEDDAYNGAINFTTETSVPIFMISCVTGQSLELLTKFLNILPPLDSVKQRERLIQEPTDHQVDEVYSVPDVGTVVGGTMRSGTITEGDTLLAGPTDSGNFLSVTVQSVQRNRQPCRIIQAGQAATLALGHLEFPIRKGMVLLSPTVEQPICCQSFSADVYLLYHSNPKGITKGFQCTVHVGNVCQTATIQHMGTDHLRTHGKTRVLMKFLKQPEYIRVGSRIIFRESRTKGMGTVCEIYPGEGGGVPR